MSNTTAAPSQPLSSVPLLLDAQAAAAALAISIRTLRAWDSSGRLPAPRRIGRMTRWDAAELRAWVAAGCPRREEWVALRDQ